MAPTFPLLSLTGLVLLLCPLSNCEKCIQYNITLRTTSRPVSGRPTRLLFMLLNGRTRTDIHVMDKAYFHDLTSGSEGWFVFKDVDIGGLTCIQTFKLFPVGQTLGFNITSIAVQRGAQGPKVTYFDRETKPKSKKLLPPKGICPHAPKVSFKIGKNNEKGVCQ